MVGRIHSIESLGAFDGPGLRCVVFMQGCPMRCLYCHNPDTWDAARGDSVDSSEVVAQAARLKPYFGREGGITLSGGEPLLQAGFATAIFAGCRAQGIHTALDTSGCFLNDAVRACLAETDLVLLDIKHTAPGKHRELTGQPLETVLSFLAHVERENIPLWVRQVIVPGWTDDESEIEALAALLRPLPSLQRVELLPYHNMAEKKWQALGRSYPLAGVQPPAQARLCALREVMADALPGKTVLCHQALGL